MTYLPFLEYPLPDDGKSDHFKRIPYIVKYNYAILLMPFHI